MSIKTFEEFISNNSIFGNIVSINENKKAAHDLIGNFSKKHGGTIPKYEVFEDFLFELLPLIGISTVTRTPKWEKAVKPIVNMIIDFWKEAEYFRVEDKNDLIVDILHM